MSLDIRSLFFAMVFIANSGALMDLSMDIASASEELILHKPDITRRELLLSGFSVGRSVIGTMTTTLMLAYSGSCLLYTSFLRKANLLFLCFFTKLQGKRREKEYFSFPDP